MTKAKNDNVHLRPVTLLSFDMVFNQNDLPLTLQILYFQVGNGNPLLDGFLVGDGVLNDH